MKNTYKVVCKGELLFKGDLNACKLFKSYNCDPWDNFKGSEIIEIK